MVAIQSVVSLPIVSSRIAPKSPEVNLKCLQIAREIFKALGSLLAGAAILASYYTYPIGMAVLTGGAAALALAVTVLGINYLLIRIEQKEVQRRKIDEFTSLLIDRARASILHNSQYTQKEELFDLSEQLRQKGHFVQTGNDDIRVKFVGTQGVFEHVLACSQALNELGDLVGAIHTPLPATPLCTQVNGDMRNLLDASIIHNVDKLLTVKSRAEVVREYLEKDGKLFVIYPQGGLEKRSSQEQEIYKEELNRYQGKLFDCVLDCVQMDPDMVGATYLFRDKEKNLYTFSIKARQANDIQKQAEWGIWLGTIHNPAIKERLNEIFDYIKANKGPDLRKEMELKA